MFPEETRGRQELLAKYIFEISKNPLDEKNGEHQDILCKLQALYSDGFRHSYSDLFPVILNIADDKNSYNVEYLMNNLQILQGIVESDVVDGKNQYADIFSSFTKLCDHLNLQISQINFFARNAAQLEDATKHISQAEEGLKSAKKDLEQANTKANSLQTELIAVLGIFAAIVMTFSGGFTLLGNISVTINNNVEIERVIITAIVCGMFFFNTLFLMMYMVSKITDRNILSKCKTEDCSCIKSNSKKTTCKCNSFKRLRLRLPYVFYFNVLCVIGIIITCIEWYL